MDSGRYIPTASAQEKSPLQSNSSTSTPSVPSSTGQGNARRRSNSGGSGAPARIRRRNRLITSCLECRRRKLKCDKTHPCGNCTKFVRDCVFLAPALDPAAQLKLAEIKEKMGTLERTLENDVARRSFGQSSRDQVGSQLLGLEESSEDDQSGPEDERDLEPTPLAVQDAAYYEDADDDLMDLGVQIGKMRITERLGGFVRPKLPEEITHVITRGANINRETKDYETARATPSTLVRPPLGPGIIAPGKDFIAPSSSFFFASEPQRSSLMQYLPAKEVADSLLEQYWDAVHYMARLLHRPTFERQWAQFWNSVHVGVEPPPSLQALVMAVLLSSVISMSEERITYEFRAEKAQLLDTFRQGTESALYRANFLRTTKVQTLQAFVMYLIPLCRREVSRAHSALTGTAIRLAECMGLHRDGTHYNLSPVDIHVRRIIWYQLCFLDIRTCEATGPRPQIHRDDFDTRLPLNVNDVDLEGPHPATEDSPHWTDMTFTLIRFECGEMHRYIWHERPKLEKKKTTLTYILGRVQSFLNAAEKKYLPMLNKEIPIQYMALFVYRLLSLRMHVMVLHRYASQVNKPMPERLRKILLSSGVQQVECAIIIETAPILKTWAWYCGALHQYHTALLLLAELYASTEHYYEDRIWKCLDYVFELPGDLTRREKAGLVLNEVVQKSQYYHSLRKIRTPKAMEESIRVDLGPATQSASPPVSTAASIPLNSEFRNFTAMPEHKYYAPSIANTSASPQSETGSQTETQRVSLGGSSPGSDMMLDIDWNEWDKLFPPEVNFGDLNLPDLNNFPRGFTSNFLQQGQ